MVWQVDSAGWVRSLTDEVLEDAVDPGTMQRGQGYARDGMVTQIATLNRGRVVVAKVQGSGPESYQTIVSRHGDAVEEPSMFLSTLIRRASVAPPRT